MFKQSGGSGEAGNANSSCVVWVVQEEAERKARQERIQEGLRIAEDVKHQKEEIRRAAGLPVDSER